jgi:hypothetical protein
MTTRIEGQTVVPPLYLDTTNQFVGVGTASPAALLHVLKDTASTELLRLARNGSSFISILSPGGSPNAAVLKTNNSVNSMVFYTGSSGGIEVGDIAIGGSFFDISQDSVCLGGTKAVEATAVLEINSTTKGFLPPRMTTTQKGNISSPVAGLVVYDTTLNKLCVYTGSGWETVTSS